MNKAQQYIQSVQNGDEIAGHYTRKAVERHVNDLKRAKKADFPYKFDESSAERAIEFFDLLKHGKGKWRGQKFNLMPWQAFILWVIYGWKRKQDRKRRFTDAYIKVARKNAKTEFMAGVGIYEFVGLGVEDPEIHWFATKKDQAKIGWDRQHLMTRRLIAESPSISKYCSTSTYRIYTNEGLGFVTYLGKDSKGEDGPAPSCAIADEYHAQPTDDMIHVVQSGSGTRDAPILYRITTAGVNPQYPCKRYEDYCKKILDGSIPGESVFAIIYDLDADDDWEDSDNWRKANPSIDYIDTLDKYLEDEYTKAKEQGGSKLINFKVKNLNKWMTVGETWLSDDEWMKGAKEIPESELEGKFCFGGLDLASKRDTTSLCLLFPPQEGLDDFYAVWRYWLPAEYAKKREKNDGVPYTDWAKKGFIHLTQGNAVDYDFIFQEITGVSHVSISRSHLERVFDGEGLATRFGIKNVAYDRYSESQIIPKLVDEGIEMLPFGQGYRSMSLPAKELERMVAEGQLKHGGNPVSRWQCSNIAITMSPAEDIKIDKSKASEKVDGMVALVMAIGSYMDWAKSEQDAGESVYNERGIITF